MLRRRLNLALVDLAPPAFVRLIRSMRNARLRLSRRHGEQGPEFYDRTYLANEHWSRHYTASHYYPLWTVIADRITSDNIGSVLDIGCGPGQLAALLRDQGLPRYLGLDFSDKRIRQAQRVCPEFEFVSEDVFASDLLAQHDYDAVLCTEFLEHVEKDLEVIQKIKSGTRFLGTVPNFPYVSHVRHFASASEVEARYSDFFRHLRVDSHLANIDGKEFFLLDGTTH